MRNSSVSRVVGPIPPQISLLDLSWNDLRVLDASLFHTNGTQNNISSSSNRSWNTADVTNYSSLTEVDISHNKLSELPRSIFHTDLIKLRIVGKICDFALHTMQIFTNQRVNTRIGPKVGKILWFGVSDGHFLVL